MHIIDSHRQINELTIIKCLADQIMKEKRRDIYAYWWVSAKGQPKYKWKKENAIKINNFCFNIVHTHTHTATQTRSIHIYYLCKMKYNIQAFRNILVEKTLRNHQSSNSAVYYFVLFPLHFFDSIQKDTEYETRTANGIRTVSTLKSFVII